MCEFCLRAAIGEVQSKSVSGLYLCGKHSANVQDFYLFGDLEPRP
jgi:hypothetical protein